jgi:ATP-dependent Lhr-like helicase
MNWLKFFQNLPARRVDIIYPGMTEEISLLPKMMPDAWPIFFQRRRPWSAQAMVMPRIVKGESLLLAAPTASGKTEAAIAPLYQRHLSFRRDHTSVLYVAPTKALVNDLFGRLKDYLGTRNSEAVRRYTGDHHEFSSPLGGFCLLTTPEALDSLQLMRPECLSWIRAIVIDEIHLLHGTARGQQLRHVIDRVAAASSKPKSPADKFQLVGMTATIDCMDEVRSMWLGPGSTMVSHGEAREIDMNFLTVAPIRSRELPIYQATAMREWLENNRPAKVLVFCNSRNFAHTLAAALSQTLEGTRWPVHLHIGILSASERERVESAMQNDHFGVCVATSTLEIGIDIGDIDIVVLADPPSTVNAFLQRIGRGNRRSGLCHVLAFRSSQENETIFKALLECARSGHFDEVHEYERPSVRFQQILSLAWRNIRMGRELTLETLERLCADDGHSLVIKDMLETSALRDVRGVIVPSDAWMDEGDARRIHSIISGGRGTSIVDGTSGEIIAMGVNAGSDGDVMYVGGNFKRLRSSADGSWYAEQLGGGITHLARIPATGGRRGLSRSVIWAIGRQGGFDPQWWQLDGNRLLTWGGLVFNRLLAALLEQAGFAYNPKADDFTVAGITGGDSMTMLRIRDLAFREQEIHILPRKSISKFREPTQFFNDLSPQLQRKEEQNAVPIPSFLRWINQCAGIR